MEVSNSRESKAKRLASSSAQREYAQAMQVIGSSSARRSSVVTAPSKRSRMQPALIPEEAAQDDWLEEDLPSPTRKTNKKSNFSFPVHKSSITSVKEKASTPTSTSSSSRFNRYSKYFLLCSPAFQIVYSIILEALRNSAWVNIENQILLSQALGK